MLPRLASACIAAIGALPQSPALAGDRWRMDPARTEIGFAIDAVGYPRTEGRFHRFDGVISVDFERPEKSAVAFHVLSASVDVGSGSFSDYVKSAAFLDADHHPSIDFVSTSVERLNDHVVRVSGDLTLLGVTKPLNVDVSVRREAAGSKRLSFFAKTNIDRLEFGMNSGFPLVSREVELVISSEAAGL
jgi:polyisoprenoid-binding protein YceI